jgi:hypothetical protein
MSPPGGEPKPGGGTRARGTADRAYPPEVTCKVMFSKYQQACAITPV